MAKPIIKTNLKGSDKIELKYNGREVDMTLSDFKLYLDEVLEPTNAVLTSTEPLRYKALLKQSAPIATTTNPDMEKGQIWTLEAYNVADATTIAALELISGTLYAVGSKYRSLTSQTLSVNAATTLSYDGSPYVVSTDVNGDFNPFINTLDGNPILSYHGVGSYRLTLNGAFLRDKTSVLYGFTEKRNTEIYPKTDDYITIYTLDELNVSADGILNYTPIEIEVYQ